MIYKIEITSSAIRDLKKLPKDVLKKVDKVIQSLSNEPRPFGCTKLSGSKNLYRVRTGYYRVLYEIRNKQLIVLIIRVKHRKDAYD